MTTYSLIYLILSIIVILVILKGRIDLISVCGICYIMYTMYCAMGYGIAGFYRPRLSAKLYYYVYSQLFIILLFVLSKNKRDKKDRRHEKKDIVRRSPDRKIDLAFYAYTAIIVLLAAINIARAGFSSFASGKEVVWENTDVLYLLSLYGSFVSFAYGIHNRNKLIWIPAILVELSIFFAGSRAFTATVIIIFLAEFGSSLWRHRKRMVFLYVLAGLAVLFMLVYRMIDQQIMAGNVSDALRLLREVEVWSKALEFNEPRVIIANYDYVMTSGIRLPAEDCIYRIIDFIPGMTKLIPFSLKYPEYFSTWLKTEEQASGGVGGTIWGESYAMFGGLGILCATLLWLVLMERCNRHLKFPTGHSYFLVSLGAYLSWYISRLDFNRVGQACKLVFLCYMIWGTIYMFLGGSIEFFGLKLKISANAVKKLAFRRQADTEF